MKLCDLFSFLKFNHILQEKESNCLQDYVVSFTDTNSSKMTHNDSQKIWDKLQFSREIAKYGKLLISIF